MFEIFSDPVTTVSIGSGNIQKAINSIIESKNDRVIVNAIDVPSRKRGVETIITLFTRTYGHDKDITFKISKDMYKVFNYSGMTNLINFTVP